MTTSNSNCCSSLSCNSIPSILIIAACQRRQYCIGLRLGKYSNQSLMNEMNQFVSNSNQTEATRRHFGLKLDGLEPNKSKLMQLEEMHEVMMTVQNEKVRCLKRAVLELQKQNEILIGLVHQKSEECTEYPIEKLNNTLVQREMFAPNTEKSQKMAELEQKVIQLEEELKQHRILVQQQDLQVKSLLKSKKKLTDRFERKLTLQRKNSTSEVQAILLEERARHLLNQADQGIERTKQFEAFISSFYDKFQDILLDAEARSSQSRHNDLQRIIELEQKLTSVTSFQ